MFCAVLVFILSVPEPHRKAINALFWHEHTNIEREYLLQL